MTKCVEELRKVLEATDLGIHSDEDFVFVCLECRTVFDDQDDCLDHRRNHGPGHSEFVHWDRHDDGDCVETYSVENEQVKKYSATVSSEPLTGTEICPSLSVWE